MWSKGSFVMEAIYTTESDEKKVKGAVDIVINRAEKITWLI